jgi:hypothetical protein
MKPGLGTAAALILGLLATIGSIAMGISNLQLLFRAQSARAPCGMAVSYERTTLVSTAE